MMRAPEPDCAERIILFFFHAANKLCAFYNTAHRVAEMMVFSEHHHLAGMCY